MLTLEQECEVDALLNEINPDEIVDCIVRKYASKSTENVRKLLKLIPEISDIALNKSILKDGGF